MDDLPAPLRPIRPTRSPASSEKSAWSSKATWPKASCALRSVISAMESAIIPCGVAIPVYRARLRLAIVIWIVGLPTKKARWNC